MIKAQFKKDQEYLNACISGDLEKVKHLITHGTSPLSECEDGISALSYAAMNGNLDVFKHIHESIQDNQGNYARQRIVYKSIQYAIRDKHSNIIDYVLETEKEPENWILDDCLNVSAINGQLDIAKKLIAKGADIHNQDNQPLRNSAIYGRKETVQFFIEQGADVKAGESEALIHSARHGYTELVDLLLKHGADIHAQEDDSLIGAARKGHANTVDLLLKHGADINAQGREAVLYAARNGHNDVLDVFVKRGIDIFDQDECPITEAIYNKHLSVAQNIIVNHNIKVPERSIIMLKETKEAAIQLGQNASMIDDVFKLIEKQNLHNKLRNNLSHKNTQPITTAVKTKEKKMKI